MRLILDAPDLEAARAAAPPGLVPLLTRRAWATVRGVAAAVDHAHGGDGEAAVDRLRRQFDAAARISPEAAAALYSLGDPARLAAAAAEVAGWLRDEGLHRAGGTVVEVGCGAGRFLQELAPDARWMLGVEISPVLAAEAALRTATLAAAAVVRGDGRGLGFVAEGSVDLVLYADSFPYVVQAGAGLPAQHLAEVARVLAPGGRAAVLNWSYRGDRRADEAEARALAGPARLELVAVTSDRFRSWDGTAYVFAPLRGRL